MTFGCTSLCRSLGTLANDQRRSRDCIISDKHVLIAEIVTIVLLARAGRVRALAASAAAIVSVA